MPVTKSAQKALHRDQRRAKFNLLIQKDLKRVLKQARKKPGSSLLKKAASVLDRAAKKKVISKNKAARLKSRLAKLKTQSSPAKKSTK